MAYQQALERLRAVLDAVVELHHLDLPTIVPDTLGAAFGKALTSEIERSGYLGGIEAPWTAETLHIYPLNEIVPRQAGYRFNANTGEKDTAWDPARYMIADAMADPVTIGPDDIIAFARHGEGDWEYHPIAPSLTEFLGAIGKWVELYSARFGSKILDETYAVRQDVRDATAATVLNDLSETERANFTEFLFG